MKISTYLSVITLNVNGLNAPIKRCRVTDWIKKNRAHLYSAYKRLTSELKTHMQKLKNENRFHANRNEKKAG